MLWTKLASLTPARLLPRLRNSIDLRIHPGRVTLSITKPAQEVESWSDSQSYELHFWKNEWPYRQLPRDEIVQRVRSQDAEWFLRSMGFQAAGPSRYAGFEGRVLEVGCGPIGFFESVEGVEVVATDTLMAEYAEHLPFSRLGKVGPYTYSAQRIEEMPGTFDFVVCSNVLDHTGDWRGFLTACLRRVGPQGQLLLYTHCRNAPSPGHTQVFGPSDIIDHLLAQGVKTIEQLAVRPDQSSHADHEVYVRCRSSEDAPLHG